MQVGTGEPRALAAPQPHSGPGQPGTGGQGAGWGAVGSEGIGVSGRRSRVQSVICLNALRECSVRELGGHE